MSASSVDLETIVKMVINRCRQIGKPVAETLAAYVAQTTLNPMTGKFYLEGKVNEEEAKELVDIVTSKLIDELSMSMNTIRLQIGYDSAYVKQEYNRQQTITKLSHESNRLIDEIVSFEPRSGNDFEGITLLYKKIYNYLLYKSKQHILGNLSSITLTPSISSTIEREVGAALESVLPRAGLRPFVSLTTPEKVAQLCQLSNIVIGIRLFNREIGKGGVGLESFHDIVNHPARSLIHELSKEIVEVMEASDNYTIFFNVVSELVHALGDSASQRGLSPAMIQRLKEELTFKRQFLIYILELKSDVQLSEQNIEALQGKYLKEVNELKELIGNKSSIPKDQVYPRFDAVSQIYSQLLEEKNLAILRRQLFKVLLEYKPLGRNSLNDDLVRASKGLYLEKASHQKEEENEIAATVESQVLDHQIIRLMPNSTPDFMHIPLDFLGFCLWTIVKHDGLLMPGKPNLGVFKYSDRYYCVFADLNAIDAFVQTPDQFFHQVKMVCRKYPELIHLLKLQEEFPQASLAALLQGKDGTHPLFSISSPLMVDKDVETPTHFIEKNIDPNYEWNEWSLRKKALQIANIRNRKTVTTQTVLSNFRRDNETQFWPPKEQATNTMKDKGTNLSIEKTYIVGLRDKNVK